MSKVSTCCQAGLLLGGKGSTHYYICEKCDKPCDAMTEPTLDPITDENGVAVGIRGISERFAPEPTAPLRGQEEIAWVTLFIHQIATGELLPLYANAELFERLAQERQAAMRDMGSKLKSTIAREHHQLYAGILSEDSIEKGIAYWKETIDRIIATNKLK